MDRVLGSGYFKALRSGLHPMRRHMASNQTEGCELRNNCTDGENADNAWSQPSEGGRPGHGYHTLDAPLVPRYDAHGPAFGGYNVCWFRGIKVREPFVLT